MNLLKSSYNSCISTSLPVATTLLRGWLKPKHGGPAKKKPKVLDTCKNKTFDYCGVKKYPHGQSNCSE